MSTTVLLTGLLPFLILIASALAIPVSFVLLRLYSKAVRRGMSASTGAVAGPDITERRAPSFVLQVQTLSSTSGNFRFDKAPPAYRLASYGRWRTALIYAVSGACYAGIMTTGFLLAERDQTVVWVKVALLFWTYVWPVAPATTLVAAYDRKRHLQVFALYFVVLLAIMAMVMARNPGTSVWRLLLYWVITNGPPTALIMAFLLRPIRAVGPLVLAFLIAVTIGSQAVLSVAARDYAFLKAISNAGFAIGLNAIAIFLVMILVGMLVFGGFVGWPILRLLGKRYGQKKFSDQSITLDALWLVFGVVQSVGLAFKGAPWILTGLVAFSGLKLVSGVGLRWVTGDRHVSEPKTLLLLRVFALGKRSEKLFDKLRKHWHYAGSIFMIAGPDLVNTTVEPHEFLDFLRGRIGRQFVSDAQDLERRIAVVDKIPDPDGRYRINEFFCHNDTWQATMEKLATSSDVILMDLRSFSPNNRGCTYELSRLLDKIDLNRVLFLVDETTDRRFLQTTFQRLWQNLSAESPNQATLVRSVRLFPVTSQNERELQALVGLLMGAALPVTSL